MGLPAGPLQGHVACECASHRCFITGSNWNWQRGGPVFGPVSLLVNWGENSAHSRAAVRITQVTDILVQGQHAVGLRRW